MKPIGYWLNRTDKAFTTAMNDLLECGPDDSRAARGRPKHWL